jgi:Uma2 family endonuclease
MSAAPVLTPLPKVVSDPLDNAEHYEIIDGVKVELPPMSTNAQLIASRLSRHLGNYGDQHDLGEAGTEVLFRLPLPIDRNRRPDVAFIPFTQWPKGRPFPNDNGWTAVPSLCVEVVSPTDRSEEVREKVEEYHRAGIRLVWVVYPRQQLVDVYEAPNSFRFLRRSDELDGGSVLPGFRLRLADLFPEPPQEPSATT